MDRYQYLLLLGACVAITLPLEWGLRARVYRRPRRLLRALLPAAAAFVAWDVAAVRAGWWTYSRRYTTGWRAGDLPVEEVLFFAVIPVAGLLSLEAVRWLLPRLRAPAARRPRADR